MEDKQIECALKQCGWSTNKYTRCKGCPYIDGRGFDNMGDGQLGGHTQKWVGVESYDVRTAGYV